MDLVVKFPGDVAGINPRIVQGDVAYRNGHILHVFAPVPLEPATEAAFEFPLLIPVLVDL